MRNITTILLFCVTTVSLIGCAGLSDQMKQANDNTKEIALLVHSVRESAAKYQAQRDAIAVSSQIQRDALEALAERYETAAYRASAAWDVAGQTDRAHSFEAIREASNDFLAQIEAQRSREALREAELRKTRSAVNFQSKKLTEAAVALMDLAEKPSNAEVATFYLAYAKDVRRRIQADSEAAADAHTKQAQQPKEKP